jgi:hyaluronan synthase
MEDLTTDNWAVDIPESTYVPESVVPGIQRFVDRVRRPFLLGIAILAFFAFLYAVIEFKFIIMEDYLGAPANLFWKVYGIATGVFLISRFLIVSFYRDDHTNILTPSQYPSVSIIVAAKNEEQAIAKTLASCMNSQYPGDLECIVVNDGSTDKTAEQIEIVRRRYEGVKGTVKVITFAQNRGKREAMANGILSATGDIIVFVDSDSFLHPDGLRYIVEHFHHDPKIGAVSGNTEVENRHVNTLTKMQSARYGVSYDVFKAAESVFDAVTCCPGCFSAYRKEAVLAVLERWRNQMFFGSKSTFGDDRSLTNFVLRYWRVVYCRKAKATTVVPETFLQFMRQQFRWKKSWIREGTMASAFMWRKHPVASFSFYTNVLLPVFGPIVAFRSLVFVPIVAGIPPIFYLTGIVGMAILFGLLYYIRSMNSYWPYVIGFSLVYVFVLIWQMPYALFRLRDSKWGTR